MGIEYANFVCFHNYVVQINGESLSVIIQVESSGILLNVVADVDCIREPDFTLLNWADFSSSDHIFNIVISIPSWKFNVFRFHPVQKSLPV